MTHYFRVSIGIDNLRFNLSFFWPGLLEVKSDQLIYRTLSHRSQEIQSSAYVIASLVLSFFASLIFWKFVFSSLLVFVPEDWLLVFGITDILVVIASWILGIFGLMYLFDFLTLPIQVRVSIPKAVFTFREVQMGRFRHFLKVKLEKELTPMNLTEGQLVLTVAGSRRRVSKALASPETGRARMISSQLRTLAVEDMTEIKELGEGEIDWHSHPELLRLHVSRRMPLP